eukprot:symbB.v1.2.023135.t1/scaffold2095.1/size89733/10
MFAHSAGLLLHEQHQSRQSCCSGLKRVGNAIPSTNKHETYYNFFPFSEGLGEGKLHQKDYERKHAEKRLLRARFARKKWTQTMQRFAKGDRNAQQEISKQAQKAHDEQQALRRAIQGKEAKDSDSEAVDLSDEDEDDTQTVKQSTVNKAKRLTVKEIQDLDAQGELPTTGLLGMKFMQQAIKQKREDAKKEAMDVLKEHPLQTIPVYSSMLLRLLAAVLVPHAAATVGLSLAVSPCSRLLQQWGDDLHSMLVRLLHSISSSDLRLLDLHYDLIHLNTRQLTEEFQILIEASQQLVGCVASCGACGRNQQKQELLEKVDATGCRLSKKLKNLGIPATEATEATELWNLSDVMSSFGANPEKFEVVELLRGTNHLRGQLEQLEKALQVTIHQAPALLQNPGAQERSKLLKLLGSAPALHLLSASLGRLERPKLPAVPTRRHVLCRVEEDLVDREDVWMDASGAPTWHGKSAMSWLKRLSQRVQPRPSAMHATLVGRPPVQHVRFPVPAPRRSIARRADRVDISKKEMLKFAIPALGISIASPFMTNIDNAFIGRLSGTKALAAMSPGSVLSDYILYLFIFLPRATTGLVARALPSGRPKAARCLGTALSTALVLGCGLSLLYLLATPLLLNLLDVAPELRPGAATYVRVRGLVAWAALMQSVALSGLLAAKDSVTPLKVVLFAALLNLFGDFFLCAWPFHFGIMGAAAATALSTLMGFQMMWQALKRNHRSLW